MPDASAELARLQEEYSKNPEGRLFVHLAEAYRRSGELEKARDILRQGLERHPGYPSAHLVLAQVQAELGEQDEAKGAWERVLQLDPENRMALRELAELEEAGGRTDKALVHYRHLLALDDSDQEVREIVARLQQGNGSASMTDETEVNGKGTRRGKGGSGRATEAEAEAAVESVAAAPPTAEVEVTAVETGGPMIEAGPARLPLAQTDAIGLSDLLVRLLEYNDSTFHAESSLTRVLAMAVGRELELEPAHINALALAALLSDVGALAIRRGGDDGELGQGEGEADRRRAQREVAVSLQLMEGISLPAGVHEAVRHQFERWDGSGYPDGLREEEIPYGARVIAIARACASLLSSPGQRGQRTVPDALDALQRRAGSDFDPVVVSVLRRVFQRRAEHGIGYGIGGRIMLVHPGELRTLSLATQLHSAGYVVEMVADSNDARQRIHRSSPRALALGAELPIAELARVIREVRGNQALGRMPILVVDANRADVRVDLLTAGADVCFASDVAFGEFKATLDALLRRTEPRGLPGEMASLPQGAVSA